MAAYGKSVSTGGNPVHSLCLFYYPISYYSQIAMFALEEKNLSYKTIIASPGKGVFQPWFFALNPKGEVPVLRDGVKVIPDSRAIVDYLEENFSNGDTPRLYPEKDSDTEKLVFHFRDLISMFPIEITTFGVACSFPDLAHGACKFPAFFKESLKDRLETKKKKMASLQERHPELESVIGAKMDKLTKHIERFTNRDTVCQSLDNLDIVLDEVEKQLSSDVSNKADWWLCCEKFTIADIYLAVFLERLDLLGLSGQLWELGNRPHVAAYRSRMLKRPAFLKIKPSYDMWYLRLENWCKTMAPILGALLAIGTAVIYKKWTH